MEGWLSAPETRCTLSSFRRLAVLLSCAAVSLLTAASPTIQTIQNRTGAAVAVAGDVIDVVGANLADGPAATAGWPLPLTLGTTQVWCNGYQAPLLSVDAGRVRIQLPWELAGLPAAQIRVVHASTSSDVFATPLAPFAPVILGADAASVTPGQTLTLRVIGLGLRDKNPVTGSAPSSDHPGPSLVRLLVRIGGAPAPVIGNALAAGDPQADAGVQTVSVLVPSNLDAADSGLRVDIGGVASDPFPLRVDPGAIRISVSPAQAQAPILSNVKFSATVDGSSDTTVKWSVDANAYGLPNTSGIYGSFTGSTFFASSNMTSPNWTLIRATHASGAFATALVQLVSKDSGAYRIMPDSPTISPGESVTFSLLGPDGNAVDAVRWAISDGFGNSSSPSYTAPTNFPPAQVNVWARLPIQSGALYDVATTTIMIAPPRTQITGTTPAVAHIGESLTFQGSGVTGRGLAAWFTMADGSRVRAAVDNNTGSSALVVPHGAVSGPVNLEVQPNFGATFLSPPYQLTVLPRLRLHASRVRVAAGESVQIVAAAPDLPAPGPLTWRADLGSVNATGMFTAPSTPTGIPTFARIWACIQPRNECGTTVVEVLPFRLEPDPLILNPGESVQLKARAGNAEVAATWSAATANVTVTPSGKLTTGAGPFDGGPASVQASYGGIPQRFDLSIRTAGAAANTAEFYDWLGYDNNYINGRIPLGAFPGNVAVKGNWIYALTRSLEPWSGGPWVATWLDVFQVDDRHNPVWVDAVEAPYNAAGVFVAGNDLYVTGVDGANLLLRFDTSGGRPVLRSRSSFSGDANAYRPQGLSCSVIADQYNPSAPITLQIRDLASGTVRTMPTDYVPVMTSFSVSAAVTDTWVAVMLEYAVSGASAELVVFDITGVKAVPMAILPAAGGSGSVAVLQDVLVVATDVYRVSGGSVTPVSQLPGGVILDTDPANKRLLVQTDGYRVVDLSDASNPKLSAAVQHAQVYPVGKLGTDYFVMPGANQGLAVYPILWQPGIRRIDNFPASPWMNAARARDGYLFWTGPGWGYKTRTVSIGIFEVDDLSGVAAAPVATMDRPGDQTGWAIELNGRYAYVGTDTELIVYDVTVPAAPSQVTVIPSPAISMALQGQYLYTGSNSGKNRLLQIYDVSSPASPKLVTSLPLPEFAYGLTAQPGWLAVAMGKSGSAIYSLANPTAPLLATTWGDPAWDVAGDKNLLYLAADRYGIEILDVSNPKAVAPVSGIVPLAAGNELYGSFPNATAVSFDPRGIAWVCADNGALYGVDVRSPARPRPIAMLAVVGCAAATVAGNHVYVAGNDAAFDAAVPQNLGLYQTFQSQPGQILPDRYFDPPPVSQVSEPAEPLKARVLNGRESERETHSGAGRPFRRDRPPAGAGKSPRN